MRRAALTTVLAMMLLVGQAITMGVESVGALPIPIVGQGGSSGSFYSRCGFSHRLPDDPIVAPGRAGASHSHDFFGNRSTNAHSTYDSLRAAPGNCHRPADAAGYWVPTLYQDSQAVSVHHVASWYGTGSKPPKGVRAFPAGLRVIAGDSRATAPQPQTVGWSCEGSGARSTTIPLCNGDNRLRLHIRFPDCWNGRDLDIVDHKSHLAYSSYGACPATHPASMPILELVVYYVSRGGSGMTLASGTAYTAHGDFFNAWDQAQLERLVRNCLNAGRNCGTGG
jgi:hypothetical protein